MEKEKERNEESEYGRCFDCGRLVQREHLRQIRYYEGHLIKGKYHHKTICDACRESADMAF